MSSAEIGRNRLLRGAAMPELVGFRARASLMRFQRADRDHRSRQEEQCDEIRDHDSASARTVDRAHRHVRGMNIGFSSLSATSERAASPSMHSSYQSIGCCSGPQFRDFRSVRRIDRKIPRLGCRRRFSVVARQKSEGRKTGVFRPAADRRFGQRHADRVVPHGYAAAAA